MNRTKLKFIKNREIVATAVVHLSIEDVLNVIKAEGMITINDGKIVATYITKNYDVIEYVELHEED